MKDSQQIRSSNLRAVLVDDEEHARRRIRSLLQERSGIDIVGEAGDGIQAINQINQLNPDIVFLDIQMPGIGGFDVVHSLSKDVNPIIVFVTAFDEYAVKAFDVNAIDYVLKPIDKERFEIAVNRAEQKAVAQNRNDKSEPIDDQSSNNVSAIRPCEKLLVKSGNSQTVVAVRNIRWIEAANKYVRLHTSESTFLMRRTMKQMEDLLVGSSFIRVHRSAIVNIDFIREIKPTTHGDSEILLDDNTVLTLSRSYRDQFRSQFTGEIKE